MEPIASPRRWLALVATVAAGAGVFWAFDALPFQDLPAHAGLMALRHRLADSPFEQRFFLLAPHLGPYSFFRAVGDALLDPLGAVGAVRFLMTMPILAMPLALGWARHRLQGEGALSAAAIGICLSFGFLTILGFGAYLLGLAALIVGYALWIEAMRRADLRERPDPKDEALLAGAAIGVLLTHGYAFAVLLGLALATGLAADVTWSRAARGRAFVPALALAGLMVWRDRAGTPASFAAGMPPGPHFASLGDKLALLASPTLMTRWGVDLLVGLLLWGGLASALALTAFGPDVDPRRMRRTVVAVATLAVAFLALPRAIGWFGFLDGRLVPLFFVLATLAVKPAEGPRWMRIAWQRGSLLAAMTLVSLCWAASYRFQREAFGWRAIVAAVPERASLLNLPLDPNSDVFTAHPFVHYDKLALVEKPLVLSDVWFHQGTALYPQPTSPALRLPPTYSESDLRTIDWSTYRLADWNYVLLRTKPGADAPVVPSSLTLAVHAGGWWLYGFTFAHMPPGG